MKKLGRGQELLLKRTLSMIVYTLATIGPLTAFGIHRKTKIHRSLVLPRALHVLEREKVIIKRIGAVWVFPFEDDSSDVKSRYRNEYYLLNWSNSDAKEFYYFYKDNLLEIDPNAPVFEEENTRLEKQEKIDEIEREWAETLQWFNEKKHYFPDGCDRQINSPLDCLIHFQLRHPFRPAGEFSYISRWEEMERNGLMAAVEPIKTT